MFRWFTQKAFFLKTVIVVVSAQFILNSIPVFAYETLDHLRLESIAERDGGKRIQGDLVINELKRQFQYADEPYDKAFIISKMGDLRSKSSLINAFLRDVAGNNPYPGVRDAANEALAKREEIGVGSFLRIVPQNVHKGKGLLDVGLGFTIEQLLALGLESVFLGHTSTRERYSTETKENLEGISRFDEIINNRIKILRGFVRRDEFERENFNSEALFPKLIEKGYLSQYWRVNPEFAGLEDDFKMLLKSSPFSYNDKQIKQIEAILQQALSIKKKIKEIHLGVGSIRKNIPLMFEKEDIEKQLGMDLRDITIDDLKEVNFNISFEPNPSIDIKLLKDEELIAMIQEVHQRIYWWFTKNYGDEEINSIWGKRLKILFRGSVIKDKVKDNATPIMSVKVKTKENKEMPGVHGVVFATSGKNVEGYLGVAQVVQEAAKRDGLLQRDDLQYVTLVNLKSITADDKDRTPREEYVAQIYAALNTGRFDPKYIIAEVTPPDIELEKWLELVAKAEVPSDTTIAEMKWQIIKQSALYFNNNLALTDIGVRSTSLSTGHPTVEAKFILKSRGGREIIITGEAASGASAGNREAIFLFDKDFAKKAEKQPDMLTDEMIKDIYGEGINRKEALDRLKKNNEGKGVEIALWIARNVLIPELTKAIKDGKVNPVERYSVDRFMREYEKTHGGNERQKLKLTGANTTAFSTAAAKLGAAFNNIETWEFLSYRPDQKSLKINYESFDVVIPIAVLIEGGEHGNWNTDWQEYMVEVRGKDFEEIYSKLKNITDELEKIMKKRGEKIGVGMEAAYMPTVTSNTEPIEMLVQAGKNFGYEPGKDFGIALDLASSEFYRKYQGKYYYSYRTEGRNNQQITLTSGKKIGKLTDIQEEGEEKPTRFLLLTSQEQLEFALDVCRNPKFYISSVEDFFDQNDLWGNMMLTRTLQDKDFIASLPHEFQRTDGIGTDAISHVADDFSTSNIDVVRTGINGGKVIFEGEAGKEELNLEKDSIDAVLLKLNQAGTVMEIMGLVEYLRSRGRTIAHSHRGKEPPKETIRADVALASTTYPSIRHDRTGAPPRVKIKYGSIRKERAIVYDYLMDAYAKIRQKIEEEKIEKADEGRTIIVKKDDIFGPEVKVDFEIEGGIWKVKELTLNGQVKGSNVRMLGDLEKVVAYPEALKKLLKKGNPVVYTMHRDVYLTAKDKEIISANNLRNDITVIPPGMVGEEIIKTAGHYHPAPDVSGKTGIDKSYTEVYVVLSGEALYYLQKIDKDGNVVDAVWIRAKAGDVVPIPSTYGHITINPSADEPLVMMNWVNKDFDSVYGDIANLRGGAYYFIKDGEKGIKVVLNPAYKGVVTKEDFRGKFSEYGEELFDWLAQNGFLERLSDVKWRLNAVTGELITAVKRKYSEPEIFKEISDFLRARQSKSVAELREGTVDNKLSEAIGLPQGEPNKTAPVYDVIKNNEKVAKLADFLSVPEDPLLPKFDGILGGSALTRAMNIWDIKMHSWGLSSKWNPFMDALRNVIGAKGALVIGADTILSNAGTIVTLKEIKNTQVGIKIAVWAKDEDTVRKLKEMGADKVADILTAEGIAGALNKLNEEGIAKADIVMINSPVDLVNINKDLRSEKLLWADLAQIRFINVKTPTAAEKEAGVNTMPLVVARAVTGILHKDQALVEQYKDLSQEYVKNNQISAADLTKLNDFTSSITEMPLVRATEEIAQVQIIYAETVDKI